MNEIEKNITWGLIAFIDILGFGAQVANATNEKDLIACVKQIHNIRSLFEIDPKDPRVQSIDKTYDRRTFAFSDCVVIHISLDSQAAKVSGPFDSSMSKLHDLAIGQADCVLNGTFLRGGIDLNWWYDDNDILVSQGLAQSHKLEESANIPVLAFTKEAYEYLKNHPDRSTYADAIDPLNNFKYYLDNEKNQEFYFLNYFDIKLSDVMQPYFYEDYELLKKSKDNKDKSYAAIAAKNIQLFAKKHAERIKEGYINAPEKAKNKYIWLAQYHNETIEEYANYVLVDDDIRCVL